MAEGSKDLPSKLRRVGRQFHINSLPRKFMLQAADEIERLRAIIDLQKPMVEGYIKANRSGGISSEEFRNKMINRKEA